MKVKKVRRKTIPERVDGLYVRLVRRANDTHIFVQQALLLLHKAKRQYAESRDPDDKPYRVPSRGKSTVAKRSDGELQTIFDRFIATELHETLLVALISQCESFLFDVLRMILERYPQKLEINIQGMETPKTVDLKMVLQATDVRQLRSILIEQRLHAISYAKPAEYLRYLNTAAHITTNDETFAHYQEIKATRDIVVHSAGIANSIYIGKAGALARTETGKRLPMDDEYFDHCIATIKRIATIVATDIQAHFTPKPDE